VPATSSYMAWSLIGTAVFELVLAAAFAAGTLMGGDAAMGFGITALILGLTGIGLLVFGLRSLRSAKDARRVIATGIAGTATITSIAQTGVFINNNPQVELGLTVHLPDRPEYPAVRKEVLPMVLLARFQPGSTLPVKVDPQKQSDVVIQWAS
jgi:hypothetical protein